MRLELQGQGNLSETVNEIPQALTVWRQSLFELHEVPFGHSTDSPSPICPVGCEVIRMSFISTTFLSVSSPA